MKNHGGQRSPRVKRAIRISAHMVREIMEPGYVSPFVGWDLVKIEKVLAALIQEFPNCVPVREAKAQVEAAISVKALRSVPAPKSPEEWPALFGRGRSYVP